MLLLSSIHCENVSDDFVFYILNCPMQLLLFFRVQVIYKCPKCLKTIPPPEVALFFKVPRYCHSHWKDKTDLFQDTLATKIHPYLYMLPWILNETAITTAVKFKKKKLLSSDYIVTGCSCNKMPVLPTE